MAVCVRQLALIMGIAPYTVCTQVIMICVHESHTVTPAARVEDRAVLSPVAYPGIFFGGAVGGGFNKSS
jgi:hypothetical protein